MAVDISFITYFLPLLTYLVVFLIVYAVSKKADLFKGEFMHLFVSFIVATVFVSAAGPRAYVASIVPWFAVLIIAFFLILVMLKGFIKFEEWDKGLPKAFGVILIILFVVTGLVVFSSYFSSYLPWNSAAGADSNLLRVTDWIF